MILKKRIAVIIRVLSLYIKNRCNRLNEIKDNSINHEYNMNIATSYKGSNMSPIKILGEEI